MFKAKDFSVKFKNKKRIDNLIYKGYLINFTIYDFNSSFKSNFYL